MNCIIYVRVSTDEQAKEGFSVSAQKERLRAFCLSQGWDLIDEYIEEGWSAKNIERPQLKRLLKDIQKGNIDIVLVYRLDRLTRSVLDLYQLLKTFDDNNVAFRSATEVYDTSTAMGRLFITLVAALAQWERENLAERVVFGMNQMLDEGKRPGAGSSYGYKFDKDFNCEIIEHEAQAIRLMFEWYIDGLGYTAICQKLDREGYKPRRSKKWNRNTIKQYLSNPIYKGTYTWGGKTIENNHLSIVDELTFYKVQSIKQERTPKSTRLGKYVLTGLLRCGNCASPMSGHEEKRSKVTRFRYMCRSCGRSTAEYRILEPLLDELERLIKDKDYFISRMGETNDDHSEFLQIKTELEKITRKKNKFLELYVDDEAPFDKVELYETIKKLNKQEQELKLQINELDIDKETPEEKYEKIKTLTDIKEQFYKADINLQKELLASVFDTVTLHKEKHSKYNDIKIDYTLK